MKDSIQTVTVHSRYSIRLKAGNRKTEKKKAAPTNGTAWFMEPMGLEPMTSRV